MQINKYRLRTRKVSISGYNTGLIEELKKKKNISRICLFLLIFMAFQLLSPFGSFFSKSSVQAAISTTTTSWNVNTTGDVKTGETAVSGDNIALITETQTGESRVYTTSESGAFSLVSNTSTPKAGISFFSGVISYNDTLNSTADTIRYTLNGTNSGLTTASFLGVNPKATNIKYSNYDKFSLMCYVVTNDGKCTTVTNPGAAVLDTTINSGSQGNTATIKTNNNSTVGITTDTGNIAFFQLGLTSTFSSSSGFDYSIYRDELLKPLGANHNFIATGVNNNSNYAISDNHAAWTMIGTDGVRKLAYASLVGGNSNYLKAELTTNENPYIIDIKDKGPFVSDGALIYYTTPATKGVFAYDTSNGTKITIITQNPDVNMADYKINDAGTIYYYKNDNTTKKFYKTTYVINDSVAPNPVSSVNATPGNKQVSLSWVNPTTDYSYTKILRSSSANFTSFQTIFTSVGTSFVDTGISHNDSNQLVNGEAEYYRLTAVDEAGNESTVVDVSATPALPTTTYTVAATVSPSGSGTVVANPTSVDSGSSSVVTATANSGYTFTSWSGACSGSTSPYTLSNITANKSCIATFTANQVTTFSVTYNGNGNNGGSVPTDSTIYQNLDTITVLGNPGNLVKTGYNFGGWNTLANGNGANYTTGQTFYMGTANVTLYAKWVSNSAVPVTSVNLQTASATLTTVGDTLELSYTIVPSNATNKIVAFSSSNPSAATVGSTSGIVTAVSNGTTTITVTTADGRFTDTAAITVNITSVTNDITPTGKSVIKNGANLIFTGTVTGTGFNVSVAASATSNRAVPANKIYVRVFDIVAAQATGFPAFATLAYPSGVVPKTTDTVMYWDATAGSWTNSDLTTITPNTTTNTISFNTPHFTEFAILTDSVANTGGTNNDGTVAGSNTGTTVGGILPTAGGTFMNFLINFIFTIGLCFLAVRALKTSRFAAFVQ